MNRDLIYKIREKNNLYIFLKYNSYLYKKILRNEITLKELENIMKKELGLTAEAKLNTITNKIELVNTFLDVLK